MVLVDTSVWARHIDREVIALTALLDAGDALAHPFVIGEIAMGNLRRRDAVLLDLLDLPGAVVASDREVLQFVGENLLFGIGIGYIDAHLLAAARLTEGASLWTFDKRLSAAAGRLGIAHETGL
jgi:predicted nucleic acid-binding protein